MATKKRKPKQHLRNPMHHAESLCGYKGVGIVEMDQVDCKTCQRLVAEGKYERLKLEANAELVPGSTSGKPKPIPKLTERQRAFAAHPLVTTNPRQAALDAGYSPTVADKKAAAMREHLAPLIIDNQRKAQEKAAISVARVQTELASMGFANMLDYFNIRDDGSIYPKQLNELTREQAAAIQEVKVIEVDDVDPETGEVLGKKTVIGHIKLADKRANLVELGKTLGMFNKITIEDKRESKLLMDDVPTSALEEAEKLLLTAANEARSSRERRDAVEGEFSELPSPPVKTESK